MKVSKTAIWIVAFVLVVPIVYFLAERIRRRVKAKRMWQPIIDKIDQGIGMDGEDVQGSLYTSKPDFYQGVEADATKLVKSDSIVWDDDETVFSVIQNKTKAQLKALDQTLQRNHGVSLDEQLKKQFSECWKGIGPDCGNYERILKMVNAAK